MHTKAVKDYSLLDSGHGRKLEQLGPYRIIRPAASAFWKPQQNRDLWASADAEFHRGRDGNGTWKFRGKPLPPRWKVEFSGGITLWVELTPFGHLGAFPEHLSSPALFSALKQHPTSFRLLNLFAYTGALSLIAAKEGAEVTHVDASQPSVDWARDNAAASGLAEAKLRWITDDVRKFTQRELRRGKSYSGIILDPPSYGRGAKGQVWKIEDDLAGLLGDCRDLADRSAPFFLQLSAHSQGYTPLALSNIVRDFFPGAEINAQESAISDSSNSRPLPSGAHCTVLWGPKP